MPNITIVTHFFILVLFFKGHLSNQDLLRIYEFTKLFIYKPLLRLLTHL